MGHLIIRAIRVSLTPRCMHCARSNLEIFPRRRNLVIDQISEMARGFGGWCASAISPRQLKEVIQVATSNVGSIATLGVLGGEVLR
jgi:hypothetical protein